MTKERKVEILYLKVRNQNPHMTSDELEEMKKYGIVSSMDIEFATKQNLRDFISDVDKGVRLRFSDWCFKNERGDRRRKIGKAETMRSNYRKSTLLFILFGTVLWGIALISLIPSIGVISFVIGAIVSYLISKLDSLMLKALLLVIPCIILFLLYGK